MLGCYGRWARARKSLTWQAAAHVAQASECGHPARAHAHLRYTLDLIFSMSCVWTYMRTYLAVAGRGYFFYGRYYLGGLPFLIQFWGATQPFVCLLDLCVHAIRLFETKVNRVLLSASEKLAWAAGGTRRHTQP